MDEYDGILKNIANSLKLFGHALNEVSSCVVKSGIVESLRLISSGIDYLGKWYNAVEKLVDNQYVFSDQLTDDFIETILNTNNVDIEVEKYYSEDDGKHLQNMIERCKTSLKNNKNLELFIQSEDAYKNNSFQLACVGLFAITDGLLSDVSQQINPNFIKRLNTIKTKFDQSIAFEPVEEQILSISIALEKLGVSIFADSDFHSDEPENVNRHWTLHGRSSRKYQSTDVIKILLWIDALLFIQNYNIVEDNGKEQ